MTAVDSMSRSSGCPVSTIWISFSVFVSRFDSSRTCSSTAGERFWASSITMTVERPA